MRKASVWIMTLASLAAGLILIVGDISPATLKEIGRFVKEITVIGHLAVIVCGVAAIWASVSEFLRLRAESMHRSITVRGEDGESVIALEAVEQLLHDEIVKSADVRSAKAMLAAGIPGEPVNCELRLRLDSQDNIPGRADVIKHQVREIFARIIPGSAPLSINCRVDQIVLKHSAPAAGNSAEAQNGKGEFSGPVYPVSDENSSDND